LYYVPGGTSFGGAMCLVVLNYGVWVIVLYLHDFCGFLCIFLCTFD